MRIGMAGRSPPAAPARTTTRPRTPAGPRSRSITIAPATIAVDVSRRAGLDALGEAWLPDSYSSRRSSSATFRSAADCQRRAGSFRRQRRITFSRSRDSPGITSARPFRLLSDDRQQRGHLRVADERTTTCDHFVQHSPEREHIRSRISRPPFRLFRRHVSDRSQDGPFFGLRAPSGPHGFCRGVLAGRLNADRLGQFGKSEVEHLHRSPRR